MAAARDSQDILAPVAPDADVPTSPDGSAVSGIEQDLPTVNFMPAVPNDFAADGGFGEETTLAADRTPSLPGRSIRFDDPYLGRMLGLYRIIKPLGAGGMGAVYLATHSTKHDEFALKIMHEGNDPKLLKRFQREARALVEVAHPNIVKVVDFGTTPDGVSFLVMEAVRGETFANYLAREAPLKLDRVANFSRQIASALGEAHRAGFIHRDLKPDNILVLQMAQGTVLKLLDFGLAAVREDKRNDNLDLTEEGFVVGTPGYMAPEVIDGIGASERADLYALGAIMYEMLSGKPPFLGGVTELLHQHAYAQPPPLAVGGPLAALSLQMLAKNPDERPPNAATVIARILGREATGGPIPFPSVSPEPSLDIDIEEIRRHREEVPPALIVAFFTGALLLFGLTLWLLS